MSLSPEEFIYKRLRTDADMAALVENRIWPDVAPEDTQDPWVVYQRVYGPNDATSHDGFDGLTEPVYQLNAWTQDAKKRRVLLGHLLRLFRMQRVTIEDTTAVLAVVADRSLSEDGPPRMYAASVDVSISI